MQRRRSTAHTFEGRLAAEKARLAQQATDLPSGPAKDELLEKIRQLDAASRMSEWLSPGPAAPK